MILLRLRLHWYVAVSALHPCRRTRRCALVRFRLLGRVELILLIVKLVGIGLPLPWLYLQVGPSHCAERIGLADQSRELCEWVAFGVGRGARSVATVVLFGLKRPLLISISHRDDASPSGKPPTRLLSTNRPFAGCHSQNPPEPREWRHITASRPEHRRRERLARMPKPIPRPEPKLVGLLSSQHHY